MATSDRSRSTTCKSASRDQKIRPATPSVRTSGRPPESEDSPVPERSARLRRPSATLRVKPGISSAVVFDRRLLLLRWRIGNVRLVPCWVPVISEPSSQSCCGQDRPFSCISFLACPGIQIFGRIVWISQHSLFHSRVKTGIGGRDLPYYTLMLQRMLVKFLRSYSYS